MALSGTTGYVNVNGVAKTADEWDGDFDQAAVDRSNFTTAGEPTTAPGQRTGEFTVSGPYEGVLGVVNGTVYAFVLGITPLLFIAVSGRVKKVKFHNDKDKGPRWTITAQQEGAVTLPP